jgi:ketopantoate reductase
VIGSVYGAHLAAAGHDVSVLEHGPRTGYVAANIAAALYRHDTDPVELAADRPALRLMCRAITEGFAALRAQGVAGLPRNLAVLHHPLLRPVAVAYWARTMRSPMGEMCFAAHARHARPEMRALGEDTLARLASPAATTHLRQLLQPP